MYFSKSKYTDFWQCPKLCWLKKYKPEEQKISEDTALRFENGNEVGDLAKRLFGDYVETTTYREDGSLDLAAMAEKTKQLIKDGAENICEAAFLFGELYCAVDILHKENDGYGIYEVKSTSSVKEKHYADAAYQKWLLEKCGISVTGAHVVVLNTEYVRDGEPDIKQLFSIDGGEDISARIAEEQASVEENLQRAEELLSHTDEPDVDIRKECQQCAFFGYCFKNVPSPSVLDLYGCDRKWELFNKGIVTFNDVLAHKVSLKDKQRRQIDFALNDRGIYADQKGIAKFLNSLTFPLYFLDFETMQCVVPEFDGTHPYEQIPFQYSLHFVESETGEAQHREFLAESGEDPRRKIAESLVDNIPQNVCILAYHASTERGIIEKLANTFPDLKDRLMNIAGGIKDLLPVFRNYYYKREIGGSFSIKSVLPAICPDLDYHKLEGVQNGTEASAIFPKIKHMPPDEAQEARKALLIYCKMDTLATVILWQELLRVSKQEEI